MHTDNSQGSSYFLPCLAIGGSPPRTRAPETTLSSGPPVNAFPPFLLHSRGSSWFFFFPHTPGCYLHQRLPPLQPTSRPVRRSTHQPPTKKAVHPRVSLPCRRAKQRCDVSTASSPSRRSCSGCTARGMSYVSAAPPPSSALPG